MSSFESFQNIYMDEGCQLSDSFREVIENYISVDCVTLCYKKVISYVNFHRKLAFE